MSNKETIERLRKEADALEAADKAFSELPEDHRLAITLHKMLCHHNHVDGCGWEYEYIEKPHGWVGPAATNWGGYAHMEYLKKAHMLQSCCVRNNIGVDAAIEILSIAKGY